MKHRREQHDPGHERRHGKFPSSYSIVASDNTRRPALRQADAARIAEALGPGLLDKMRGLAKTG